MNVVLCCDGTGNKLDVATSNVVTHRDLQILPEREPTASRPWSSLGFAAGALLLCLMLPGLTGCARKPANVPASQRPQHRLPAQPVSVAAAFAGGGVYAEDSMYACLPGGPNPCEPPHVERGGRKLWPPGRTVIGPDGNPEDLCHSVVAHVLPDDPECAGTITVENFGEPNLRQLLVFGLQKFGGPTFVIPVRDDDPKPKPKPGERPNP